jgi:hypothetical protein
VLEVIETEAGKVLIREVPDVADDELEAIAAVDEGEEETEVVSVVEIGAVLFRAS